jgi:hypothetical protein
MTLILSTLNFFNFAWTYTTPECSGDGSFHIFRVVQTLHYEILQPIPIELFFFIQSIIMEQTQGIDSSYS